ncbi:MAG: hypothetical protein Kow0045_05020 [Albidovulum sp.]
MPEDSSAPKLAKVWPACGLVPVGGVPVEVEPVEVVVVEVVVVVVPVEVVVVVPVDVVPVVVVPVDVVPVDVVPPEPVEVAPSDVPLLVVSRSDLVPVVAPPSEVLPGRTAVPLSVAEVVVVAVPIMPPPSLLRQRLPFARDGSDTHSPTPSRSGIASPRRRRLICLAPGAVSAAPAPALACSSVAVVWSGIHALLKPAPEVSA